MQKRRYALMALLALVTTALFSQDQEVLSLDQCRDLALKNSKSLLIQQEKAKVAHLNKKAAFTGYLPKVSATGSYIRNQKEVSLLSDEVKQSIKGLGGKSQEHLYQLAEVLGANSPIIKETIKQIGDGAFQSINAIGDNVINGLRTDTRNMYVGQISLLQPLYMGGKIRAYNKITKFAEKITYESHNLQTQNLILSVDETYWMVISLINKQKLAESYLSLLNKLDADVESLIEEGVATKADGLAIKVKVNEAEMTMTKVNDGLVLSKMLLCQLCGLDLHNNFKLVDEDIEDFPTAPVSTNFNLQLALNSRPEIRGLGYATEIYRQKVRINRAGYLPQVALFGNYMVTNPAFYNGFENKFKGAWHVGIAVKIPLLNWGEHIYKTKAAQAHVQIANYELEEVKEKLELQINQAAFKVHEATKKLNMAQKNMEKAQENLDHATYGFEEGVIPSNIVLEAHTNWLAAQSEKIDAQLDIKLTNIYFKKSIGTLTK